MSVCEACVCVVSIALSCECVCVLCYVCVCCLSGVSVSVCVCVVFVCLFLFFFCVVCVLMNSHSGLYICQSPLSKAVSQRSLSHSIDCSLLSLALHVTSVVDYH